MPRFDSVRSVHLRTWSAGNASSGSIPSGAGQARFFGGILLDDHDPLVALAHDLADELLRVPAPVRERGVDEVQAEVDRAVQRLHGLVVLRAQPHVAADAPGAVADLGHAQARPAQPSLMHQMPSSLPYFSR